MTSSPETASNPHYIPFRDTRWSTVSILLALLFVGFCRALTRVDREWFLSLPAWVLIVFAAVLPQGFVLIFPLVARRPRGKFLKLPTRPEFFRELGVAIGVLILCLSSMSAIGYLVEKFLPGTPLTPDMVKDWVSSPKKFPVYLILCFSFTVAPIAEELFFRGFLYTAFCARIPIAAAMIVESALFAAAHAYSAVQCGLIFVIGLFLTGVYQWRKTLLTPMLVHAGFNFIMSLGVITMMSLYNNSPVLGVLGEDKDGQCAVTDVVPESAAALAGVKAGDFILTFDQKEIHSFRELAQTVVLYKSGDKVPISILRDGNTLEVTAELKARNPDPS